MSQAKYSWFVTVCDVAGKHRVVKVDGDECRVGPGGVIYILGEGRQYTVAVFAPGAWREIEIMSQATGLPNGWDDVKGPTLLEKS